MDRQEDAPHGRGGIELDRLLLFSDAVFAIAITLLVLELKVPERESIRSGGELLAALGGELAKFAAFFISFAVIGVYWIAHHRMFRCLRRCDEVLVALNLVLLLFVAFLPFPVALFGAWRRDPVAIGWYVTSVALSGLSLNLLWWYATGRRRLVSPDFDRRIVAYIQFRAAFVPIVFAISLPFAFVSPMWTSFSAIATIPFMRFIGGRLERAAKAAERESQAALPAAAPVVDPAPGP